MDHFVGRREVEAQAADDFFLSSYKCMHEMPTMKYCTAWAQSRDNAHNDKPLSPY
jgi:hypothetical protein